MWPGLAPRDRREMNVPVPEWPAGGEPSGFHFVLSPPFCNYSGLMLHVSKAYMGQIGHIPVTESLVFVLVSFIAAARNDIFMSITSDLNIVVDALRVLVPRPDRLNRWMDGPGLLTISCNTGFDTIMANAAFHSEWEVHWSCVDFKVPTFSIAGQRSWCLSWQTRACRSIGEADSQVLHRERLFPSIATRFNSDVRPGSLDDAIEATKEASAD